MRAVSAGMCRVSDDTKYLVFLTGQLIEKGSDMNER